MEIDKGARGPDLDLERIRRAVFGAMERNQTEQSDECNSSNQTVIKRTG